MGGIKCDFIKDKEEAKIMKNKCLLKIILIASIVFSSVIYASYNTNLQIQGDAYLRSNGDIRITGIEMVGGSNGASELYIPKLSKNTTSMFVTLPSNSTFQYAVTITNKDRESDYIVSSLEEISHNSNVTYEYELVVDESIIDAPQNSATETSKTYTITISNTTENLVEETLVLEYTFEELKYTASDLTYYNDLSTKCSSNRTAQCALDELASLIN